MTTISLKQKPTRQYSFENGLQTCSTVFSEASVDLNDITGLHVTESDHKTTVSVHLNNGTSIGTLTSFEEIIDAMAATRDLQGLKSVKIIFEDVSYPNLSHKLEAPVCRKIFRTDAANPELLVGPMPAACA